VPPTIFFFSRALRNRYKVKKEGGSQYLETTTTIIAIANEKETFCGQLERGFSEGARRLFQ